MATLLGIEFEDEIGGSSRHRDGGAVGWEAFDSAMKGIEKFSCSDPSMEEDFEKMKKTMRLAQSLSYYRYHYDEQWDQVSKESLWKQVKEAFEEEYPVMIPVYLEAHAISIIFYQDQVMICNRGYSPTDEDSGIHVYKWTKALKKTQFFELIESHTASNEKQFLNGVHQNLGLVKKHVVELTDQEHENCAWASMISPGMKATLLALRLDNSFKDIDETFEEVKPFAKEVNHFIKFHMVDTYLKAMFKFMRKTGEEPCYAMLGKLVERFVYKIENNKDSKGFYKRALDAILFSGASIRIAKKNSAELTEDERALTERLARIYHVKPKSLGMNHRFT